MKYIIYLAAVASFLGITVWADIPQDVQNVTAVSCSFCNFMMNTIESIRSEQHNEEITGETVENICSTLPPLFQADCHSLLEHHGDKIIEFLNGSVPAEKICSLIELCPTPKDIEDNGETYIDSFGPFCKICQVAVKELYNKIGKDKSIKKIKKAIQNVCRIVPKMVQSKCRDAVDKYSDLVVSLILKAASPDVICSAIHAC